MLTLTAIALASGLAALPAPGAPALSSGRLDRARLTLDRMTSGAQIRLRHQTVDEALNSGVRTFTITLNRRIAEQKLLDVAAAADAASPSALPLVTK